MSTAPIYRLSVYKPRSEDSSEATVLTPVAGAPHSEAFQIASASGVTDYQPYLDTLRGRRGRIDPITRTTDTGQLVVRCLDKRVGTTNAERWVTAFIGSTAGKGRLIGRKVVIEESVDGGGSWHPFFTGRVQDVRLSGRLWFELVLRDMAEELNRAVFTGKPISVSYASVAPLLPRGVAQTYGDFSIPAELTGTLSTVGMALFGNVATIALRNESVVRSIVTKALNDLSEDPGLPTGMGTYFSISDRARLRLSWVDGATTKTGDFRLMDPGGAALLGRRARYFEYISDATLGGLTAAQKGLGHWYLGKLGITELPVSDPDYLALPPSGTTVTFRLFPNEPASKENQLFLSDVHPVQLWKDLLDGKFSRPSTTGAAVPVLSYDSTAFDALIADTSIPAGRFRIQEEAKLNEWVEKYICQPYDLAYRLDAEGSVVPIDMRLPASVPTSTTISDADVEVGEAPGWNHLRDTALTRIEVTHYAERTITEQDVWNSTAEFPETPPASIDEEEVLYISADFESLPDYGEYTLKIDAPGYRHTPTETIEGGQDKGEWVRRKLEALVADLRGPFGSGAMTTRLRCRRTANTTGCNPGDWRLVDVDALPNPSNNQRGGTRLMRCLERTEDGPAILFSFLDAGPNSVATAPVVGALSLDSTADRPAVLVPITLNASSEPARVEFAATNAAVGVRPDDGSGLWTFGGMVAAAGTLVVPILPDDVRIWVRARTQVTEGSSARLPSGWDFPTGAGYIDTPAPPRVISAAVDVDASGVATATWEANLAALGMRLTFAIHAEDEVAPDPLTSTQDADGTTGSAVLSGITVRPGETITVDLEPYTGWTGSAVSGTAGDKVRRETVVPPELAGGNVAAVADADGLVSFVFAGNTTARSFGWKVSASAQPTDSTGATIVDAISGSVSIDDETLTLSSGEVAYITGWFYPAAAGAGQPGKPVYAIARISGITYPIDPTHPLSDGEFLATLRRTLESVSDAIGMAQSYVYGFGAQAGEAGLPIDKILTMPIYDPTGLILLIDTATRQLKSMAFGADVVDSAARAVNRMLAKASSAEPDDARGLHFFGAGTVESLKPGEAGANVTETRTAADVQVGAGKAVKESGAEPTTGKSLSVLINRTADLLSFGSGATVESLKPSEAGANVTESRTSADTSNVNGSAASTVQGGAARANTGLNSDGTVGDNKIASDAALISGLIGTYLIADRLFGANVFTNALFTKLMAADVGAVRKMIVQETLVAGDIIAESLAALSAVLGEVVAGILFNTTRINNPTAALRLSSDYTIPASVLRYVDLAADAAYFLFHPSLKLPNGGGTAEFSGNIAAAGSIGSPNYVAGSTGWRAYADGNAEFNEIIVRGVLQAGTVVVDGSTALNIARGVQSGTAADGETIVFDTPFPAGTVPIVRFLAGGFSYLAVIGNVDQGPVFTAENVSETGFKARLKLVSFSGAPAHHTVGFVGSVATKNTGVDAIGLTYVLTYSVTVHGFGGGSPSKSSVTVGFYSNDGSGSGYVLRGTKVFNNFQASDSTFSNQTVEVVASGMGVGDTFQVVAIAEEGAGGSVTPSSLDWDEATLNEQPATATGRAVPWLAIGGI